MTWIALLLFAGGVVLIVLEFFVPGLVLGTVGTVCLIASTTLLIMEYPRQTVWILILEGGGGILAVFTGLFIFPRTPTGRYMTLGKSMDTAAGYVSDVTDESLLGQTGEVVTQLRPAGIVVVGDRRIDAVSSGGFIAKGTPVQVIEVHGNRVVVEAVDNAGAAP